MSTSPTYPATPLTVVLLIGTALMVLTQLYLAIPLITPVSTNLQGNATFALSIAFSLCYALGFLVWGPLSDRYGRKKVLLIGMILLVATTALCSAAPNLGTLAALRGIQGFAAASFAPIALAYLAEATPPRHRPLAIGAMSTAFLVAGIFGQVFAATLNLTFDTWRAVFAISSAILALCCALLLPARNMAELPRTDTAHRLAQSFAVVGQLFLKPRVQLLCLAHLTVLLSFVAMYTALGTQLTTLGSSPTQLIWLRLVGLPGMFVALTIGFFTRRLGIINVARISFLIAALGLALEALLASTLWGIAASSLVFVVGIALVVPTMITLFGETSAPYRAGGMAINGAVLFVGASLGPLTAQLHLSFSTLLCTLAALLLVACGCLTLLEKISRKDPIAT
ncbi:MAG: MFS transporter [Corynebacterium sp.]|nr:MFS transporter [Corynebacterium sp.]